MKIPEKIFCIVVAYIFGNLIHLTVRMYQQLFGFVHTNIIQIVDKFLSGLLFEKLAEIASVQVKEGSDEFLSDIFLIVSLDIKLNLIQSVASIVDTLFLQQGCNIQEKLHIIRFYFIRRK